MQAQMVKNRLDTIMQQQQELKKEKMELEKAKQKLDREKVYQIYRQNLTRQDVEDQCEMLKKLAKAGDTKALELLYKIVGEFAPQQIEAVNLNIDYAQYLKSLEGEEF